MTPLPVNTGFRDLLPIKVSDRYTSCVVTDYEYLLDKIFSGVKAGKKIYLEKEKYSDKEVLYIVHPDVNMAEVMKRFGTNV